MDVSATALTPCSHCFCLPCMMDWCAQKLLGTHKAASDRARMLALFKSSQSCKCPTCNAVFVLSDMLVISQKKASGPAQERLACPANAQSISNAITW